jgi:hypothetical protein
MPTATARFKCGAAGNILAAQGISLKPVNLPLENGKLIIAELDEGSSPGEISVDICLDSHTTTLTIAKKKNPNPLLAKLAIRIPIGVRFFPVEPKQDGFQLFFHETGDGYNTLPYYLGPGEDTPNGQTVQELILITSHVPPRRDPATLRKRDFASFPNFAKLELSDFKTRLHEDGLRDLGLAE